MTRLIFRDKKLLVQDWEYCWVKKPYQFLELNDPVEAGTQLHWPLWWTIVVK